MDRLGDGADIEKTGPILLPSEKCLEEQGPRCSPASDNHGVPSASGRGKTRLEQILTKYSLEARGIQRVEEHERFRLGWLAYLQVLLLWVSINLAANNVTLGMLGPAVYGLSFKDASLCAAFGSILGSVPVAWIATWGPRTGLRTLVRIHDTMGYHCLDR